MGVSGIILAGGRSSRMGQDKTLLQLKNETLIERTIKKLQLVVDEIIIASNHTHKYNLPGCIEVPDLYPDMGPLGGLHAGLMAAKHPYAFVISADMPFFSVALARYLLRYRAEYDVIVPEFGNCLEPLCAVYSQNCVEPMERCLLTGVRQVWQMYSLVKVRKIVEKDLKKIGNPKELFCNLNTPEDLKFINAKGEYVNCLGNQKGMDNANE